MRDNRRRPEQFPLNQIILIGFIFIAIVALYIYLAPAPRTTSLQAPQTEIGVPDEGLAEKPGQVPTEGSSTALLLKASETAYQSYVRKRQKLVKGHPESINPWPKSSALGLPVFWDYFIPQFSCPYSIDRVGDLGDGGKFVCGLEVLSTLLDRPCIVYSFGVSTESSFEAEMLEKSPCEVYAFDASVNKMGHEIGEGDEERVKFTKMFIGANDTKKEATLGRIMEQNGHDWIDILKMDIEGKEFGVIGQIMEEFKVLPFGQLLVEFHGDQKGTLFPVVYDLWERMEVKGLRPFKNEVNPWEPMNKRRPSLMEYAFLNTKGQYSIAKLD